MEEFNKAYPDKSYLACLKIKPSHAGMRQQIRDHPGYHLVSIVDTKNIQYQQYSAKKHEAVFFDLLRLIVRFSSYSNSLGVCRLCNRIVNIKHNRNLSQIYIAGMRIIATLAEYFGRQAVSPEEARANLREFYLSMARIGMYPIYKKNAMDPAKITTWCADNPHSVPHFEIPKFIESERLSPHKCLVMLNADIKNDKYRNLFTETDLFKIQNMDTYIPAPPRRTPKSKVTPSVTINKSRNSSVEDEIFRASTKITPIYRREYNCRQASKTKSVQRPQKIQAEDEAYRDHHIEDRSESLSPEKYSSARSDPDEQTNIDKFIIKMSEHSIPCKLQPTPKSGESQKIDPEGGMLVLADPNSSQPLCLLNPSSVGLFWVNQSNISEAIKVLSSHYNNVSPYQKTNTQQNPQKEIPPRKNPKSYTTQVSRKMTPNFHKPAKAAQKKAIKSKIQK